MKKIPMRQCLATNQMFPKKDLFRVVRTPQGDVCVDYKGKTNGRGAYISKTKEAIMLAKKKKVLNKKLEIEIPETIYDELLQNIGEE